MKRLVKVVLNKTFLRPRHVTYCSQTIYQSLLGCIKMWEFSKNDIWKQRADQVLDILLQIQCSDGGFDIGYEFNFGKLHRPGEATSPELVGLTALVMYAVAFGNDRVAGPAARAANWIEKNARSVGVNRWAIPYAPYSTNEIMIYNGTSFAAGALGCYLSLGLSEQQENLIEIYEGFVNYLDDSMSADESGNGRFWYYADQARADLDPLRADKIDNYHQMQQVETHSLAEKLFSVPRQNSIIDDASSYILSLCQKEEPLPYTNNPYHFKGYIHVWGFASLVSGLLEAADILSDRRDEFHRVAEENIRWLISNAWSREGYFYPIVDRNGIVKESRYMVRSDAWVFNTLASAAKYLGDGPWVDVAEECFSNIERVDYSGPESHASTPTKRFISKAIERSLHS